MTAGELAEGLRRRDLQFRTRGVQIMLLCALTLRPLPAEVSERIAEFAAELVRRRRDDQRGPRVRGRIPRARRVRLRTQRLHRVVASRRRRVAAHLERARNPLGTSQLPTPRSRRSWARPRRTSRTRHIGRKVWELYRARGFAFPGSPGSAPPLLAQHDWVHVLADFGTTVESELEVFAFIARANDDMRAFSLLAMVISLFETGYLRTGAGLFEYSTGHLSANTEVAVRLADAMRRGALCRATPARRRRRQHRLPPARLVRARGPAARIRARSLRRAAEVGRGGRRRVGRPVAARRDQPVPDRRRPRPRNPHRSRVPVVRRRRRPRPATRRTASSSPRRRRRARRPTSR